MKSCSNSNKQRIRSPRGGTAIVALTLGVGVVLTGCGSSDPSPAEPGEEVDSLASLTEAAQAEGELTFLGGVDEAVVQRIAEAFESEYGITVHYQRLSTGDQKPVVEQQFQAQNVQFDVSFLSDEAWVADTAAEGHWASLDPDVLTDLSRLPAELQQEFYVPVSTGTFGVIYNVDNVDESELPKNVTDLLDDRWRGKLAVVDPELGGAAVASSVYGWSKTLGDDFPEFLDGLMDQDPVLVGSAAQGTQMVGAGELDLAVLASATFASVAQEEGLPVELYYMDPATIFTRVAQVPAKASHPNAGRLFVNWMVSPEGQEAINGDMAGSSPYDAGVTSSLPLPEDYLYFPPSELKTGLPETLDAWIAARDS